MNAATPATNDAGREASVPVVPQVASATPDTVSRLEASFRTTAGDKTLQQFGYDTFLNGPTGGVTTGAIGDDYMMGVGDEIIATFYGRTAQVINRRVDSEGRLILPELAPIAAAGRTFGQVRRELEERVKSAMIGTEVFISVGAVRMISVVVVGEVTRPGMVRLTGLSNLLDALYAVGGVTKMGSLRRITLYRNGKTAIPFDTYDLLIHERAGKIPRLSEGDRIVVPPIGPTVAVSGGVKRPGIYELKNRPQADGETLLQWAGGPLRPTGNLFTHHYMNPQGRKEFKEVARLDRTRIGDGELLLVRADPRRALGSVNLIGHVRRAGLRPLADYPTVARLIGAGDAAFDTLDDEPYLPFAVLASIDQRTMVRQYQAIDLGQIIRGVRDYPLTANDRVIVLGRGDIQFILSQQVQDVLVGKALQEVQQKEQAQRGQSEQEAMVQMQEGSTALADKAECTSVRNLATLITSSREGRFAKAARATQHRAGMSVGYKAGCRPILEDYPDLLPFLLEHVVVVSGEVRNPGVLPIIESMPLSSILALVGGLTEEHDPAAVEISRERFRAETVQGEVERAVLDLRTTDARTYMIATGDIIHFKPKVSGREGGWVLVGGEFMRPGYYDISRGERLSSVIQRAGGVTTFAYPLGAVFTRERIKEEERRNMQRVAQDLRNTMLGSMQRKVSRRQSGNEEALLTALNSLVEQLEGATPVGRLVVEADPTVLSVQPELDVILEPGDTIYMPKRSNVITVVGEVLNPGTLIFRPGVKAHEYITQSGGFQNYADEDRVFLIRPNGTAQPLHMSAWNFNTASIPPGSTIMVPRDPEPFDLIGVTEVVSKVISDLAVSAAAMAVIGNN